MTFTGFGPATFEFLRTVAAEQNKPWFEANKATYEQAVRWPMTALVADLTSEMTRRRLPLHGDPKRSVFRIHRDTRFAKDKAPYKTNVGATLTKGGTKMGPGLLYIHIEPKRCFTAAGFYRPEAAELQALRTSIVGKARNWRKVLEELADNDLHLGFDEDSLKRPPRGFDGIADAEVLDALRRRSFIVRRELSKDDVATPDLVAKLADFAGEAMPLLRFGWAALGMG